MVPVLREDYVAGAVLDPEAMDIDVNAVHQGFLRGLRARGGTTLTGMELIELKRADGLFSVVTSGGTFTASTVINAAGAWCGQGRRHRRRLADRTDAEAPYRVRLRAARRRHDRRLADDR